MLPAHAMAQGGSVVWERVDVLPRTTLLSDVWAYGSPDTNNTRAIAVGQDSATSSGVIYHFDGTSWVARGAYSNAYLRSVWGVSPTDVFAVGENIILRYNGWLWVSMPVHGAYDLRAVWASGPNDAFAVGQSGLILHYAGPKADPWTEWTPMNSGTATTLNGIWGSGPNDVWAVGGDDLIFHYDGAQWTQYDELSFPEERDLRDIHGTAANNIFAVGDGGLVRHYNGTTWDSLNANTTENLRGVHAWNAIGGTNHAYTVSYYGGNIYDFDGTSWVKLLPEPNEGLYAVSGADGAFFAVGFDGVILRGDAGNSTWKSMSLASTDEYFGIWGSGPDDVFVVGDHCRIVHNSPGLGGWYMMPSGTGDRFTSVWGTSAANVYSVLYQGLYTSGGSHGGVYHYDGVSNWSEVILNVSLNDPCLGIWGSGPGDIFVVGQSGMIKHFNGNSWSTMNSGTTGDLQGIWGSSSNDVYAVGINSETGYGMILRYDGNAWGQVTPSQTMGTLDSVWGSASNDVFAVGSDTAIWHYNGSNWAIMTPPPPDPSGGWGGGTGSLCDVWGSGPSDVFAVGAAGRVYHYNGTTWERMNTGTLKTLRAVWGSSTANVYAVGEDGLILHYPRTTSPPGGWITPACCAAGTGNMVPILSVAFIIRLMPWVRHRSRKSSSKGQSSRAGPSARVQSVDGPLA
jgi:hypothetical protein